MSVPTVALNEDSPAGSAYIRGGDDRIREYKLQVREILAVDHNFPSSGQSAQAGYHKQLTLTEAADIGTGATGYPILGGQTVSGKPELCYTDEDNNDVQLTSGGALAFSATANKTALVNLLFPIGFIYITTVSTNPGTYLGGTWAAFGAGKVLVGLNGADTDFDTAEETGGSKTHTLTTDEMPSHTHSGTVVNATGSYSFAGGGLAVSSIGSTGGGSAHNNLQPYTVVYMWKRTA